MNITGLADLAKDRNKQAYLNQLTEMILPAAIKAYPELGPENVVETTLAIAAEFLARRSKWRELQ